MEPPAPSPDLKTLAPAVAARVAGILAGMKSLVASRFLRIAHLVPILMPLWTRYSRAAERFAGLMADFAAGRIRETHPPRHRLPAIAAADRPAEPARLPRAKAWLLGILGWEVAVYRTHLQHLLAEPGVAVLLAAVPAAQSVLNPIRHTLGLPTIRSRPPGPGRRRPELAPPPPAPPPPAPTLPPLRPLYPSGKAPDLRNLRFATASPTSRRLANAATIEAFFKPA